MRKIPSFGSVLVLYYWLEAYGLRRKFRVKCDDDVAQIYQGKYIVSASDVEEVGADYGLHLLHQPTYWSHSIIFVHGLGGDHYSTWNSQEGIYWIKKWLPLEKTRARVLTFGYDFKKWGCGGNAIATLGKQFYDALNAQNISQKPIIFVGHSLGGYLIKWLLLQYEIYRLNTLGVTFYATPHLNIDWSFVFGLFGISFKAGDIPAFQASIDKLHGEFNNLQMCPTMSLGETTPYGGRLIAPDTSSNPGYEFNEFSLIPKANHISICYPESQHELRYQILIRWISRLLYGLRLVYEPPSYPTYDIVFVHGLGGGKYSTWTNEMGVFWPKMWLAKRCPQARILSFGYNDYLWGSTNGLATIGQRFYTALKANYVGQRPIVFLGHGLGGRLIKWLLLQYNMLRSVCLGTVFFSTPHFSIDWSKIFGVFDINFDPSYVASLETADGFGKLNIASRNLGETSPFQGNLLVPQKSSDPGYITDQYSTVPDANHLSICTPKKEQDFTYQAVIKFIDRIIFGLFPVSYPSNGASCDIVFVHGLGGTYQGTWRSPSGVFWPKAWLARALPGARILSYGYNNWSWGSPNPLQTLTNEFQDSLAPYNMGQRPIIWVAHGLGGWLVKSLLGRSAPLRDVTLGSVFYSTPHQVNSDKEWDNLFKPFGLDLDSKVLGTLKPEVGKLHSSFGQFRIPTRSLGETETYGGLLVIFFLEFCGDPLYKSHQHRK